jgi:hypothetical protein
MVSRWFAVAACLAGTATAQPAQPKPPAVRTCISLDVPLGLRADQGQVLSCPYASAEPCTAYRPHGKPIAATSPGWPAWPAMVSESDGKLSACSDDSHCKPLGKRLAAAIRAARAASPGDVLVFLATSGLDAVIVSDTAWSVPKDRALALRPPADVKPRPKLVSLVPVGAVIVATWSSCELGCARGVVVDPTGANRGAAFAAGVAASFGDRIAIVATEIRPVLTIVAAATGKALATLVLGKDIVDQVEAVALDDHTLAVAARVDDAHQLMWIDAPADHPPAIAATTTIPICK